MHPQHDQLLRDLICGAASSDQLSGDLSVIDAGWEFCGLLARVAAESSESDWSPEIAGMIGQARVELAQSGRFDDLGGAAHWGTSDRRARGALLGLLARETDGRLAVGLAGALGALDPTVEDRRQARGGLLGLLAYEPFSWVAADLAHALGALDPTVEDRRQARGVLLGLLAYESISWVAADLARALGALATTAEDRRQARGALLGLLAREPSSRLAVGLAGWARSTRRRKTGARPAACCSGCWPARPASRWPQIWHTRC